ncbi:MAG: hypothetical protein HYY22_07905 [Thaumarchaeota archaeon]|nr:hypothetical protein [Nitrososphaerota archaeon]
MSNSIRKLSKESEKNVRLASFVLSGAFMILAFLLVLINLWNMIDAPTKTILELFVIIGGLVVTMGIMDNRLVEYTDVTDDPALDPTDGSELSSLTSEFEITFEQNKLQIDQGKKQTAAQIMTSFMLVLATFSISAYSFSDKLRNDIGFMAFYMAVVFVLSAITGMTFYYRVVMPTRQLNDQQVELERKYLNHIKTKKSKTSNNTA